MCPDKFRKESNSNMFGKFFCSNKFYQPKIFIISVTICQEFFEIIFFEQEQMVEKILETTKLCSSDYWQKY